MPTMPPDSAGAPTPISEWANMVWGAGRPSGGLVDAGVLVHVLDWHGIASGEDREFPERDLWKTLGKPLVSVAHSDRVSSTVLNRAMPSLYHPFNVPRLVKAGYERLPFVILNSTRVQGLYRCCYPHDAGSIRWGNCPSFGGGRACVPGCKKRAPGDRSQGGSSSSNLSQCLSRNRGWQCHIRRSPSYCVPEKLWGHNEIILDSSIPWNRSAFVIGLGIERDASDASVSLAGRI